MPIPDFQTLMRPLLELVSDSREHRFQEAVDNLALKFSLTPSERVIPLPSGRQPLFTNRVAWAKTHLKMAGLIDSSKRGSLQITDLGRKVLSENPTRIDIKVLRLQPGYEVSRNGKRDSIQNLEETAESLTQTPEERIAIASLSLRESLVRDLITKLRSASPAFFENLVVELLVAMGYGGTREDAGRAIGRSGDEGIDGIINEDRLGLDVIYVQAKRWAQTVGRPEIQKFAGALQGFRARKGIFLTTSDFSREAGEYAARIDSKIVLIDGRTLCQLMIDYGIGVSRTAVYEIKKIDHDYFDEENS